MNEGDPRAVNADPATLADLHEQADVLSTKALTDYARTRGITSPDQRPGWYIVAEYPPDLTEPILVWASPDDE